MGGHRCIETQIQSAKIAPDHLVAAEAKFALKTSVDIDKHAIRGAIHFIGHPDNHNRVHGGIEDLAQGGLARDKVFLRRLNARDIARERQYAFLVVDFRDRARDKRGQNGAVFELEIGFHVAGDTAFSQTAVEGPQLRAIRPDSQPAGGFSNYLLACEAGGLKGATGIHISAVGKTIYRNGVGADFENSAQRLLGISQASSGSDALGNIAQAGDKDYAPLRISDRTVPS